MPACGSKYNQIAGKFSLTVLGTCDINKALKRQIALQPVVITIVDCNIENLLAGLRNHNLNRYRHENIDGTAWKVIIFEVPVYYEEHWLELGF